MTLLMPLAATCASAVSAECQPIRFKPGETSAQAHGRLAPDEIHCFRFGTGNRQRVRLEVKSASGNVAFTINDLVDNRDRFEFTSAKKTYEFTVYQTIRSGLRDDYSLTLSLK